MAGGGTHSELPLLLPRHNRLLLLVLVLLVAVDDFSLASLSIRTHAIDLKTSTAAPFWVSFIVAIGKELKEGERTAAPPSGSASG